MSRPQVLIFHRPPRASDPPLARLLADVRLRVARGHAALLRAAGAGEVTLRDGDDRPFGAQLAAAAPAGGGLIVMGSGAVPRLRAADAGRLVAVAGGDGRRSVTNNRYSSDVCAISDAAVLAGVPPLPSDNALPRWLEERAGFSVDELPGRQRLALDIDTPLDIGLWALAPERPAWVAQLVEEAGLTVPKLAQLRALAADPHAELLVFGRAGSATLRWLERNVRCRVRFLAEERGLRAASAMAIGGPPAPRAQRRPRASLGMLLDAAGPDELAAIVAKLADGAIVDSRVLMAHHYGADEQAWPAPADRYASDLLRPAQVAEPWLRALTDSARASGAPIVLGAHSLVGPGVPLMLKRGQVDTALVGAP
jgi:CTP:molybdopterin cytidylyltransferase MocA